MKSFISFKKLLVLIALNFAVSIHAAETKISTDKESQEIIQENLNILALYEAPDPIEGYNRVMFDFNSFVTGYILKPIGKVYSFIIPDYGRKGIARMADNIEMPGRFINSLLQARWQRSLIELSRFGINTTMGVAGFWDFADSEFGMIPQTNSFGMTFAYWGIGPGFYIILPIQGGTTLRDGIGLIFDWFADPLTYIPPYTFVNFISLGIKATIEVNDMTLVIDDYSRIYEASKDPYYTMKNLYFAMRLIKMQDLTTDGLRGSMPADTSRNEDGMRYE